MEICQGKTWAEEEANLTEADKKKLTADLLRMMNTWHSVIRTRDRPYHCKYKMLLTPVLARSRQPLLRSCLCAIALIEY